MSTPCLNEDDLIMLEALIQSPAFGALKRCLNQYRDVAQSVLMSTKDPNEMFEHRGRLLGLKTIEQLPVLIVEQHKLKEKRANDEKNKFKDKKHRLPTEPPAK